MMRNATQQDSIHIGSTFDSFLEEEGIRNEVDTLAIKRVLAWQLEQAMKEQKKTKRGMATELQTSRSQLDRLLDPANTAVSLDTIARAVSVLGKRLVFEIHDMEPERRKPVRRNRVVPLSDKVLTANRSRALSKI